MYFYAADTRVSHADQMNKDISNTQVKSQARGIATQAMINKMATTSLSNCVSGLWKILEDIFI